MPGLHRKSAATRGKRPKSRTWRRMRGLTDLFAGFESRTQTCGQTNAEARAQGRKPHAAQTRRRGRIRRKTFPFLCLLCSGTKKTSQLPFVLLLSPMSSLPRRNRYYAIKAAPLLTRPDDSVFVQKREKTERRTASRPF